MSEVQEEIVEKAAQALYEAHWGNTIGAPDWGTVWLVPSVADDWRRKAKATVAASGLPAAIEARDKALERVKALEAALENYFQAFDHGGTLLQTADKLCELRDVFRWGHP